MSGFPRFSLDGQVALVTGAARGLGRATALALAQSSFVNAQYLIGFHIRPQRVPAIRPSDVH